jgi:hypothetical protein
MTTSGNDRRERGVPPVLKLTISTGFAIALGFVAETGWIDQRLSRIAVIGGVLLIGASLGVLVLWLTSWKSRWAPLGVLPLILVAVALLASLVYLYASPIATPTPSAVPTSAAPSTPTPTPSLTVCPSMTLTATGGSNHVYYMYNSYGAATYYDDFPYRTTWVVSSTFVESNKGNLVRITSGSYQGVSYAGKYVLAADISQWGGHDWQSHCP